MVSSNSSAPAWKGVVVYIALTFTLAWIPALLLRDVWVALANSSVHRLFVVSLLYAVMMGWQPLVSVWIVRRWVDSPGLLEHGLKPARSFSFFAVAAFAPLMLAVAALGVAVLAHQLGLYGGTAALGVSRPLETTPPPSLGAAVTLMLAFICSVLLIWLQALSEEYGWRGYFLARLMQLLGPWWGLLFHGLVWGLWYAPPLLLVSTHLMGAPLHAPTFALTCMLLGALLGWLRLASRSILPTTVANATLTLAAGLPFLLQGTEVGLRGAAYGPPGWLPMAVVLLVLALGRCRSAVKVPEGSTCEAIR